MEINEKLSLWYEKAKRDLPWRETSDPYKIWISEIILQQTRVAQGLDYYRRFIEKFPDIRSLADAEADEVLKVWQGLGYYSRARNMHETARIIAYQRNGEFPDSYSGLLELKGVGEYTAAAISSISYKEARAAVDGNVKRVISRLFAVDKEINSSEGKKIIGGLAHEILDKNHPGRHNQAVMELGAKICLPRKPLCISCPVNNYCQALMENKISDFPVKYKKNKSSNRFFLYLVIRHKNSVFLTRRSGNDIWKGLYEFPLIETPELADPVKYPSLIYEKFGSVVGQYQINKVSGSIMHQLSHRVITCSFIHLIIPGSSGTTAMPWNRIDTGDFADYPVPKLIERYISNSGF